MPLYEYECTKCQRRTEKIEPVNGPHIKKCPHCGGKLERQMSAPAIQFKGSGWYVTDYAGKKPGSDSSSSDKSESKDSAASNEKDSAKDSSKDSAKTGGDSKDKKPATKKKP